MEKAREEAVYQVVAARKLNQDSLLWQVPSLSLTAQAFLFSISLGNSSKVSRIIASALSVLMCGLTLHLMGRHRILEVRDSKWLEEYEKQHYELPKATRTNNPFTYIVNAKPPHSNNKFKKWYESSYNIWFMGLIIVGLVSVGVFVLVCVDSSLLSAATG